MYLETANLTCRNNLHAVFLQNVLSIFLFHFDILTVTRLRKQFSELNKFLISCASECLFEGRLHLNCK